jgi:hypothetical protein
MSSEINNDPAAAIEFAPKVHSSSETDLPKAIPTEATEVSPKGRIIDDSARGTIFWEVERDEAEGGENIDIDDEDDDDDNDDEDDAASRLGEQGGEADVDGPPQAWGKPFKLEWLSTTKLPFYRTRGLRNPWNSNREVKIARDGTELEPSVGRRLISLFNRVQSPNLVAGVVRPTVGSVMGYQPMCSFPQ